MTVSTGIITTIVGTGATTFSGDGGVASSATLFYPYGIALDSVGTYVISIFVFNIFLRCFQVISISAIIQIIVSGR